MRVMVSETVRWRYKDTETQEWLQNGERQGFAFEEHFKGMQNIKWNGNDRQYMFKWCSQYHNNIDTAYEDILDYNRFEKI